LFYYKKTIYLQSNNLYRICSLKKRKIKAEKVKAKKEKIVLGIKVETPDKGENKNMIYPRNRKPLLLVLS
jgi:hypothetical protein